MQRDTKQLTLFTEVSQPSKAAALPPSIASHAVKEVAVCRVLFVHSAHVWRRYELCSLTLKPKIIQQGSSMRGYKEWCGRSWSGCDARMRTLAEFELQLRRRHGSRYAAVFQEAVRSKREQLLPRGWQVEHVYAQPMLEYTFELHEPDAWITYRYDEEIGRIKKLGGSIPTLDKAQRKKVKYKALGKFKNYIRKRDKWIEDERRREQSLFPDPF